MYWNLVEALNREEFDSLFIGERVAHTSEELFWLVNKVEEIKPESIIEIGVAKGGSLVFWDRLVPKGGFVLGIDNNPETPQVVSKWWDWQKSNRDIHIVVGDSISPETIQTVERLLHGGKVDFLYIDGEHDPYQVYREFITYGEFVRYGGLIGLHDISPWMGIQYFFDTLRGKTERYYLLHGVGLYWKEHLPNGPIMDNHGLTPFNENRIRQVWESLKFERWKE